MKLDDFTSAESWTILTRKNCVKIPRDNIADIMLGTIRRMLRCWRPLAMKVVRENAKAKGVRTIFLHRKKSCE